MQIEIFLDQTLSDITFEVDALDEWKEIAQSLGLEKQQILTKGKDSPIPYPWINRSMENVFSTLCPMKVDYKQYDKTPIPLEVMRTLSFTIKDKHFDRIEIWYDDKSPDPFLIGLTGFYTQRTWGESRDPKLDGVEFGSIEEGEKAGAKDLAFREKEKYLIAKWGDVKRDFEELKKIASERFVDLKAASIKSEISKLTEKLSSIEINTKRFMLGEIRESEVTGSGW